MDRIICRHISRIFAVFLFFCFLIVVFPQAANAASSHVQLGGQTLINDNQEHRWNDSGASISGWTSGSYVLSQDSSTLHINGLKFSSDREGVRGLYSDAPLTIIATGTNSITAKTEGIIVLQGGDFRSLSVSGNGDSSLTITTTTYDSGQAIMASSGSFDSIKLTSTCQNDEYGVFYTGDLAITNSTVNASSLSAGTFEIKDSSVRAARYLYANASTGTSSISRSQVIAYDSVNIFNPLEIKDNASLTGGEINCSNDLTQSNGLISTLNGAVTLYDGDYVGSGGSLSAKTDIIVRKGDMTLKGTTVRAESGKAHISGNLNVSAGSLTVDKGGLYVGNDLRLSGSGRIRTTAEEDGTGYYKASLQAVGKFIVDGGTLQAFQNGSAGNAISVSGEAIVNGGTITAEINNSETNYSAAQFDNTVYLQGGQFTATAGPKSTGISCQKYIQVNNNAVLKASGGTGHGIHTLGSFTLNSGTVTASSQSRYSICTEDKLQMKGGELILDSESCLDIVYSENPAQVAGDIWLSAPADGNIHFNQREGYICSKDGTKSSKAVLQKADSISIKSAPTGELYVGDRYDPANLVLNVKFADGSVAPLSYKTHRDMFTLNPSPDVNLSSDVNQVQVKCLTKTTAFDINVKELGMVTLSGTADTYSHHLNWTQSDGATSYKVYGKKQGESSFTLLTTTSTTSFDHNELIPCEPWEYTIEPVRNCSSGAEAHGERSNIIKLAHMLEPPAIQEGGVGYDSSGFSWNRVSGASGYEIYRSEDGEHYDKISYVTNTSFKDSGLVTGREYSYYVRSAIPDYDFYSDASNVIKAAPVFSGTTKLSVKNTGKYVLSWDRTDGATGYEIWRGKGASGSRTLLTTTGTVTSYTDTSADIYTVYNYMLVPIRTTAAGTFKGKNSNIAVSTASIKPPKKDDPSGTKFNLLQARSGKITKTSVLIKWKKVSGAKKYVIYGNKCGTKNKYKKLKTITGTKLTFKKVAGKKVKKGTYYKFIIYAVGKNGKTLSTSKTVHVATPGGKVGNDKSVKTAAKKNKVTLKKGKTFKLKAKAVPASKKLKVQRHRKMAYETSNNKIAKVTSKGVIKAVGKGTCYVYAYTQNGVFAKIKVTVK